MSDRYPPIKRLLYHESVALTDGNGARIRFMLRVRLIDWNDGDDHARLIVVNSRQCTPEGDKEDRLDIAVPTDETEAQSIRRAIARFDVLQTKHVALGHLVPSGDQTIQHW